MFESHNMIERNVQLSEGCEQAEQKAIQEHGHHGHRELPMQPCFHSIAVDLLHAERLVLCSGFYFH
jgi:hypothetical protein